MGNTERQKKIYNGGETHGNKSLTMHEIDNRCEIPWRVLGTLISKKLSFYCEEEQYEFTLKFISTVRTMFILQMCTLMETYFL